MKINIVIGGTFHLVMLAQNMIDLGHDVKIYSPTPSFKIRNKEVRSRMVYVPMFFQLIRKITNRPLPSLCKLFDSLLFDFITSLIMRETDLLYGFAGVSYFCGKKQKKKNKTYFLDRGCPHVDYQNNLMIEEANKLGVHFSSLDKQTLKRCRNEYALADKILVPSKYTYDTFLEKGFDEKKLLITPVGAKTEYRINEKKKINTQIFTVGFIGGSLLRKGGLYLVQAWKEIKLENSRLILRASKRDLEQSKELKKILKEEKNIEFIDYLENINDFYSECNVFCVPSVDEGYGMTVLESMANGTPVIASKSVGASMHINDGINGFIVNTRSSKEIGDRIRFLYENRSRLEEISTNATQSYQDYLDSDISFISTLRDALEGIRQ